MESEESPTRTPATVYCDESGFSGNNLLDREQPYFVYAAVVAESNACASFVSELITEFSVQGGELKGSRLLKFNRGRQVIDKILGRYCAVAKVSVHQKRFALASKFFEYVFEPVLAAQNSMFYGANFHRFIAAVIYMHMEARQEAAERLIADFAVMMKELDGTQLSPLVSADKIQNIGDTVLEQITLFASLHKDAINEELLTLGWGEGVPNWVLDLTTTSLFTLLSEFAVTLSPLTVYCDASKPLMANKSVFGAMVNRPDMLGGKDVFGEHPFGFDLSFEPQLVNSKDYAGVQIADIFASATAFCIQNQTDPSARRWREQLRQSLSGCHIVPDLQYSNLKTENGFVGVAILSELVRRSLQKQNLFDGMQEFIHGAHLDFRGWRRELSTPKSAAK